MLLIIALSAALAADKHRNTPAIDLPADQPRSGWSQPMQPATGPHDGPPPDMPQGSGPRATSGGPLFDIVAVAQPDDGGAPGVSVAAAGAAPGSFVELTELGNGHTIVALVGSNQAPGGAVLLSAGAFQALGIAPGAGVRVRSAMPSPQDQTALRSGAAASARIDAPEVLLKALRKRVPHYAQTPVVQPPSRSTNVLPRGRTVPARVDRDAVAGAKYPPPAPAPATRNPLRVEPRPPVLKSGYVVQVAALSAAGRANDLARSLGGRVIPGGGLYRVQLGPYGNLAAANRARDEAARHGYRDARVSHTE